MAQNIKDSTIYVPVFTVSYAGQIPMGDMVDRFGLNSSIGVSGGVKTKNNWQWEGEGTFFFSRNVKENTLTPLATPEGYIINSEGKYANILVSERGFTGVVGLGKVFPMIGPNPNSGIIAKMGVGFMRHKIRIDNENNLVPELTPTNLRYYDRLTFGFLVREYVGYQHLSNSRLANFTIGIEAYQGFNRGMRDYQVDLKAPYLDHRLDLLIGIRIGWVVPVYRKAPKKEYYR